VKPLNITPREFLAAFFSPEDSVCFRVFSDRKDDEPDYVFHGVGFSSKSLLYKMSNDTIFYKMVG